MRPEISRYAQSPINHNNVSKSCVSPAFFCGIALAVVLYAFKKSHDSHVGALMEVKGLISTLSHLCHDLEMITFTQHSLLQRFSFRQLERQFGSAKFGAFVAAVTGISTVAQIIAGR